MIVKSRLRLHGHLLIKKNGWLIDEHLQACKVICCSRRMGDWWWISLRMHSLLLSRRMENWHIALTVAWSFADPDEWMIDESRSRLHVHLLIKRNGWLTKHLQDCRIICWSRTMDDWWWISLRTHSHLLITKFKVAWSFAHQDEWTIDELRLRLHVHFLIKKNAWLTKHLQDWRVICWSRRMDAWRLV